MNYNDVGHFDDLAAYLKSRIEGTRMGKVNKSKGIKNYSVFEEFSETEI